MNLRWVWPVICLNWRNVTANAGAFWTMSLLMAVQNMLYFMLWVIFLSRVKTLNGWGLAEIGYVFGAGALGIGIFFSLFGGINTISQMIRSGSLDIFMARPQPVLLSILLSRIRPDSIGDIFSGIVMIVVFYHPSWHQWPMIFLLSFLAGAIFLSFRLIMQALSFWGVPEETSDNGFNAFLIAATNPLNGFGAGGKLFLLTVIPAGYISLVPVEILRGGAGYLLAVEAVAAVALLAFAVLLFEKGLLRYASGSQFQGLR